MTEIVIQADLGGLSIAFTEQLSGTVAEDVVNQQLDRFTKAIGRQRSKFTLSEKLVDLLATKKTLETHDQRLAEELKKKAEERMRINMAFRQPEGRRLERPKTKAQLAAEQQNDEETAQIRRDYAEKRKTLEDNIPILEAQISRLRAVIAGRDPTEALEQEAQLTLSSNVLGAAD
jgi:hypothetical protein